MQKAVKLYIRQIWRLFFLLAYMPAHSKALLQQAWAWSGWDNACSPRESSLMFYQCWALLLSIQDINWVWQYVTAFHVIGNSCIAERQWAAGKKLLGEQVSMLPGLQLCASPKLGLLSWSFMSHTRMFVQLLGQPHFLLCSFAHNVVCSTASQPCSPRGLVCVGLQAALDLKVDFTCCLFEGHGHHSEGQCFYYAVMNCPCSNLIQPTNLLCCNAKLSFLLTVQEFCRASEIQN